MTHAAPKREPAHTQSHQDRCPSLLDRLRCPASSLQPHTPLPRGVAVFSSGLGRTNPYNIQAYISKHPSDFATARPSSKILSRRMIPQPAKTWKDRKISPLIPVPSCEVQVSEDVVFREKLIPCQLGQLTHWRDFWHVPQPDGINLHSQLTEITTNNKTLYAKAHRPTFCTPGPNCPTIRPPSRKSPRFPEPEVKNKNSAAPADNLPFHP
jgi:hypothetical protein